jgi:hypothetical protein
MGAATGFGADGCSAKARDPNSPVQINSLLAIALRVLWSYHPGQCIKRDIKIIVD